MEVVVCSSAVCDRRAGSRVKREELEGVEVWGMNEEERREGRRASLVRRTRGAVEVASMIALDWVLTGSEE